MRVWVTNMSNIIKYQIIHYYPNKTALEFINIGIMAYNDKSFTYRLIDKDFDHFICPFLSKKALQGCVSYLEKLLSKITHVESFKHHSLYLDDFSFSDVMLTKYFGSIEEELDSLYHDYIAYKFEKNREFADKRIEIRRLSKELIENKFKRYASWDEQENVDFVLRIKQQKNVKNYPTIIGSLFNDNDLFRAFKPMLHGNISRGIYGYINSERDLLRDDNKTKQSISSVENRMHYLAKNFSTQEKIEESIEELIKV